MARRLFAPGLASMALVSVISPALALSADRDKATDWKEKAASPAFWEELERGIGAGAAAVVLLHDAQTEVQMLEGKYALITTETFVEAILDTTLPGVVTHWDFAETPERRIRDFQGAIYHADGRVQKLDKKDVVEEAPFRTYSLYKDLRTKRVAPAGLGPRTIVEIGWRLVHGGGEGGGKTVSTVGDLSNPQSIRSTDSGGGYVLHVHRFDGALPTRVSRYTVISPPELGTSGMAQRYATRGTVPAPVSDQYFSADGERMRLTWEATDRAAVPDELLAPPLPDRTSYIALSPSGLTWAELGELYYRERMVHDITVDKPVEVKLAELTRGLTAPEEKARAIMRYVESMTTVPVPLTQQPLESPPARAVIEAGAGDSRAKSILAVTLLRGAGLRAYPVLVRSRELGRLEEALVALPQFDRMIVAVELAGSRTWFDPTGSGLGNLSPSISGVRGLLLDEQTSGLLDVGSGPRSDDRITRVVRGTLGTKGELEGTMTLEARGAAAAEIRRQLTTSDEDARSTWMAGLLRAEGGAMTVEGLSITGLDAASEPLLVKATLRGPVAKQGEGGVLELDPFITRIRTQVPELPKGERRTPLTLSSAVAEVDTIALSVPAGYQWSDAKRTLREASPAGRIVLDLKLEGGVLTAARTLEVRRGEWPPESYERIQAFTEAARRGTLPAITLRP